MIEEHSILCPYCKKYFEFFEYEVLSLFIFYIIYCKNCGKMITLMGNSYIY